MTTQPKLRIKASTVFTMKNGRKRYIIVTAHRNGDVSYAPENNNKETTRLSRTEFTEVLGKLVETQAEVERRILRKEIERKFSLQIAIEQHKSEVATAHEKAIKEDFLHDVERGLSMDECLIRLDVLLSEENDKGYDAGYLEGAQHEYSEGQYEE